MSVVMVAGFNIHRKQQRSDASDTDHQLLSALSNIQCGVT